MSVGTGFLAVLLLRSLSTAQEVAHQGPNVVRHGYAQCIEGKNPPPVPVFESPCNLKALAELKCGEPIDILGREGPWLKIRISDGSERYLGFFSGSLSPKKFVAIDLPASKEPYRPDCKAFVNLRPGTNPPRAVYTPAPEYSNDARKAQINGTVQLELTVGTDGLTHEIAVKKPLGYGLDEKALEAVQQWRFDPATEDGKAVSKRITVEVSFRL
jgi:TonB family protein